MTNPPPLPSLRDVIARHGLAARKSLGQHFLLDGNLTDRIVRQAGTLAGRHVIEIGPGPGGLTRSLLASDAETVTVVELDQRAAGVMEELREAYPTRLRIVMADAMALNLAELVPAPRHVVANLPYNVGTPLLVDLLRNARHWERLTLMFQLEVVERICATPDTDAYGRLSVLANWVCETVLTMKVPPSAFTPPPKIWSAVARLTPKTDQPDADLFQAMEKLTAAAFGQRRKMLRGSLKTLDGTALLAQSGIDPTRRAETLSIAEFDQLARLVLRGRSG